MRGRSPRRTGPCEDTDQRLTVVSWGSTDCPDVCGPARASGEVVRDHPRRYDPSLTGVTEVLADIENVTGIDVNDRAPIFWSQETSLSEYAEDIRTLLQED